MRATAGILMDGQQRRHAAALGIDAAQQVAGTLGRDHHYVNIFRRLDGFEMNGEAVGEAEYLTLVQVRLDGGGVELGLGLVGRKNLDPVGALGRFGGGQNGHAVGSSLLGRTALGIEADNDVVSAVAQILRLCMSLRTVSENGDGLAFEG